VEKRAPPPDRQRATSTRSSATSVDHRPQRELGQNCHVPTGLMRRCRVHSGRRSGVGDLQLSTILTPVEHQSSGPRSLCTPPPVRPRAAVPLGPGPRRGPPARVWLLVQDSYRGVRGTDTDAALFCAGAGLGGSAGREAEAEGVPVAARCRHTLRVLLTLEHGSVATGAHTVRSAELTAGLTSFACDAPTRCVGRRVANTQPRSAPSARVSVTESACDGGPSPQSKRRGPPSSISASAWRHLHARVCQ